AEVERLEVGPFGQLAKDVGGRLVEEVRPDAVGADRVRRVGAHRRPGQLAHAVPRRVGLDRRRRAVVARAPDGGDEEERREGTKEHAAADYTLVSRKI